jgi:hypothetical protein
MDRKYRQRGYSDRDAQEKKRDRVDRPDRPDRPTGEPRPKQDAMGPRTPRMVGTVMRGRCASCGSVLMAGFDPNGECPRCKTPLHCCKQCANFDTGRQFECTQPILVRIAKKDAQERLPVLRISHDGGKRYFAGAICRGGPGGDQSRASERRTKGLRRPLQEVSSFLDD